jgi:Xaa-Pro aminopeptidase
MSKPREEALGDLDALERAVNESAYDAVVAVSPENVRYAGDVHIATQRSIRDRLAFVLWPKGRAPLMLVCAIEAGYVAAKSWIGEVRTYREFVEDPMVALAGVLHELGLDAGRIALETEYLAAKYYLELMRGCPRLTIAPAEPIFARVRMFKTPREKALVIEAFHATEKAFLTAFSQARAGEPERAVAIRFADAMLRAGADQVTSNYCNAGANTGYPHMVSSSYEMRCGDILKGDAGGLFRQYYSNVGRTAKLGEPSAEDRSIWQRLREVHHTVIDACRPGRTGRELFELAKNTQTRLGLDFTYAHNGHSLGLNIHERPIIGPREDIAYAPGMITTVETRARIPGRVGYHMEDVIEITDGAPIWHARYFPNEELLVVG